MHAQKEDIVCHDHNCCDTWWMWKAGKRFEHYGKKSAENRRTGERMSAWLGSYGTGYFGEKEYPAPAAVIMQYTGLSQITGDEVPTYACVGTGDGIAPYKSMESYISKIKQNGTNAKIEVFKGLSHGFGLGQGTVAEGWIDNAVRFWEENMT